MKSVQLSIIGLTYSQSQNNAYALLLGEENGPRRLPIVIGAFEAQSIAIALEKDLMPPDHLRTIYLRVYAYLLTSTLKKSSYIN